MCTNMRTASPGPFLFSESSVPARHTHSFLTHNFNWSRFLSNCNNQVIHSRLFPAYYSFSRLLSQSCAEAQEVIVFWMSFLLWDCKGKGWLNASCWWTNGSAGLRKDGFIGHKCFDFIVHQHLLCNVLMCFHVFVLLFYTLFKPTGGWFKRNKWQWPDGGATYCFSGWRSSALAEGSTEPKSRPCRGIGGCPYRPLYTVRVHANNLHLAHFAIDVQVFLLLMRSPLLLLLILSVRDLNSP